MNIIVRNMFIITLFYCTAIIHNGCEDKNPMSPNIKSGMLFGIVIDSLKSTSLDSVYIVERCVSDSLFFLNDSINRFYTGSCRFAEMLRVGTYVLDYRADEAYYFLRFDELYAYKSGYYLWHYNPLKDTIVNKGEHYDSLAIRMVKK